MNKNDKQPEQLPTEQAIDHTIKIDFQHQSQLSPTITPPISKPITGEDSHPDNLSIVGKLISNRYQVIKRIGSGGSGSIFLVNDLLEPTQATALKVLPFNITNQELLPLFKAEFAVLKRIEHQNIVNVYDFGSLDNTTYFYTMELIDGVPIDTFIQESSNNIETIVMMICQTCEALSYLHSRNIKHFDLKPGNILVKDGQIKVLDFGLTGLSESIKSDTSTFHGTPAYMAPEVLDPLSIDHRYDLYSLGILFFKLVTGQLPFSGRTKTELVYHHIHTSLPWETIDTSHIPSWVIPIITTLCAKKPSERYDNANAVIDAINTTSPFEYKFKVYEKQSQTIQRPVFVGRTSEIESIYTSLIDKNDSHVTIKQAVCVLSADQGYGKTRLLEELSLRFQMDGLQIINASCHENQNSDFAMFSPVILYLLSIIDQSLKQELINKFGTTLVKLHPPLAAELQIEDFHIDLQHSDQQLYFIDSISQLILSVAKYIPVIIHFENLHQANFATLEIIILLLRSLFQDFTANKEYKVALIISFRPQSNLSEQWELFTQLYKTHNDFCTFITLSPLETDDVKTLVNSILPNQLTEQEFDTLNDFCKGIPGNIVDYVHAKILGFEPTQLVTNQAGIKKFDLNFHRIKSLYSQEQTILFYIALSNSSIRFSTLQALCAMETEKLASSLNNLTNLKFILCHTSPTLSYSIYNEALTNTILTLLDANLKQLIHKQIYEILTEEDDSSTHDKAFHLLQSGQLGQAIPLLQEAAHEAKKNFAYHQAIQHYQQILDISEEHSDTITFKADLHLNLGICYSGIGQYKQSIYHLQIARNLYETISYPHYVNAKVILGKAHFQMGNLEKAKTIFWEVATLFKLKKPSSLPGIIFHTIVSAITSIPLLLFPLPKKKNINPQEQQLQQDLSQALITLTYVNYLSDQRMFTLVIFQLSKITRRLGFSPEYVYSMSLLSTLFGLIRIDFFANFLHKRVLNFVDKLNNKWIKGITGIKRVLYLQKKGKWEELKVICENILPIFQQTGDMFQMFAVYINISFVNIFQGNLLTAYKQNQECLNQIKRTGTQQLMAKALWSHQAWIEAKIGKLSDALEQFEVFIQEAEQAHDYTDLAAGYMVKGDALLAAGEFALSIASLEKAIQVKRDKTILTDYESYAFPLLCQAHCLQLMTTTYTHKSEKKQNLKRIKKSLKTAQIISNLFYPNYKVPTYIAAGMYYSIIGKPKQSNKYFEKSRKLASIRGLTLWQADAYLMQARCFIYNRVQETETLIDLIQQAQSIYQSCGATTYVDTCKFLLENSLYYP